MLVCNCTQKPQIKLHVNICASDFTSNSLCFFLKTAVKTHTDWDLNVMMLIFSVFIFLFRNVFPCLFLVMFGRRVFSVPQVHFPSVSCCSSAPALPTFTCPWLSLGPGVSTRLIQTVSFHFTYTLALLVLYATSPLSFSPHLFRVFVRCCYISLRFLVNKVLVIFLFVLLVCIPRSYLY